MDSYFVFGSPHANKDKMCLNIVINFTYKNYTKDIIWWTQEPLLKCVV